MKQNPISLVLGTLFVIVFAVTTFFLISANHDLRKQNSAMQYENKTLEHANEKLQAANTGLLEEITKRDAQIAKATAVYDSLHHTLQTLNNKNIITTYETYSVVSSLDLHGQLRLLADYLSRADSIRR